VEKQNKPQQTSEEEAPPTPPPAPLQAPLQARSPYRPLSLRKRQEQVIEPPPAVERPVASARFDASPTKISAALAKAGAAPEETALAWSADGGDIEVEPETPPAEQ
jgi:hypothetical protein